MSQLINRMVVREFILQTYRTRRPGMPMTRVSADALAFYENWLRELIEEDVMRHPTRGHTHCDLISQATRIV